MRTNVKLEAWTDYYMYDDGTHEEIAALLVWPSELDLPLLQPRLDVRLNGQAYRIVRTVIEEDGSQTITCRRNFGYNRFREQRLADLKEAGWRLAKEYNR